VSDVQGARQIERDWRDIVAMGVVAGDLSIAGLARVAGVPAEVATWAHGEAVAAGVIVDDRVDASLADELTSGLSSATIAAVHAGVALQLMSRGPEHFAEAVQHGRAACEVDQPELVRQATVAGRLALAAGEHQTAELLLQAAADLDHDESSADRSRLLLDLARAADGCGRVGEARDLLSEVVRLASAAGEHDLVVDAAIRSAFPPDWRAGDRRTSALLDLAEQLEGDGPRSAPILAARAMVEMRLPASADPDQQLAWVTRSSVAQPLAERAVALSAGTSTHDRLVTLAAWRSTHRSPAWLDRRLEMSHEATDLAQRVLDHDRLVDAGVALAVDQLESGRRAAYDATLATIRWAAATDGNPRLRWWAATMTAGAALLDGDWDSARQHRSVAHDIGAQYQLPGWVAAELLLAAELALAEEDEDELRHYLVPIDTPVLASPIARSSVALISARFGHLDDAREHARISFRALDEESSYLLCLSLLAMAAVTAGDQELMRSVGERLEPWGRHLAVDASGWWCLGPVDLTLAELALADGRVGAAVAHLGRADPVIRSTGDVRARARAEQLRSALDPDRIARPEPRGPVPGLDQLTDRERQVLALVARGHTNASIGAALAYSPSTIRADTVSIYRKLGVTGRAEAAAVAVVAGLADQVS